MTLRPTSSWEIRSASASWPAARSAVDGLAERDVGRAGELVERVEVAAGPLAGLQRLGQLAERVDGLDRSPRPGSGVEDRKVLAGYLGHRQERVSRRWVARCGRAASAPSRLILLAS